MVTFAASIVQLSLLLVLMRADARASGDAASATYSSLSEGRPESEEVI